MKTGRRVIILLLGCLFILEGCKPVLQEGIPPAASSFAPYRVAAGTTRIGYLWLDSGQIKTIQDELKSAAHNTYYQNLTHLNLAFANPATVSNNSVTVAITDDYGGIALNETQLKALITLIKAKNRNLRIGLSVAGAGASVRMFSTYATLLNNAARRTQFVNALVNFAKNTGCHYIDMDIEWKGLTHTGYNAFVQQCYDTAKANGINFTLTLEYKYPKGLDYYGNGKLVRLQDLVHKTTLQKCDLLNIMSYDYNSKDDRTITNGIYPPHHSPLNIAERDIAYFIGQGVNPDRITLGLPFYGRKAYSGDVLGGYNELADMTGDLQKINGITSYFNGTNTVKDKLKLVKKYNLSGVMFWSVRSDRMSLYSKSMLKVVVDNQNL